MNGPQYNNRFGAGATSSNLNPVVLILMIIAIVLMLLLPRKYVVVPLLLTVFLTPFGQQVYVLGVHIFIPRILIACGWIRIGLEKITSRTELASGGFTSIDKIFILWAIFRATATYLEFMQVGAIVNQCGFLLDSLGGFFLLRFLIRDQEDVVRVIKAFVLVVVVLSVTMLNEKMRGENLFGFIGGTLTPLVRDGATRSQGTFEGPIPAGTFAATLMCLFFYLWKSGKAKLLGIIGAVGSSVMVLTSASSTPLVTIIAVMVGIVMWPVRRKMRIVRWGAVILLISLHLIMKSPVWFLINRVDFVSGNSGYHRAMLIDMCVRHFWDWWLIGVQSSADWGWDMWDQANQFVSEAESGGLATLICFILLVSRSFGRVGKARKLLDGEPNKEWMMWLLGVAMFSYVVAFFGISCADQLTFAWYTMLVLVCTATAEVLNNSSVTVTEPQLTQRRWGYSSTLKPQNAFGRQPVDASTQRTR